VFHDNHRIARVAQALKGSGRAAQVPRMETHARFIEHRTSITSPGAQDRWWINALGFAAGECPVGAGSRSVRENQGRLRPGKPQRARTSFRRMT